MYDDCDVTSHCPDVSHAAQARPDALMGLATYSIEQYMYADLGRIAYPLRAALLHTRRAAQWRWVPVDGRYGTRRQAGSCSMCTCAMMSPNGFTRRAGCFL